MAELERSMLSKDCLDVMDGMLERDDALKVTIGLIGILKNHSQASEAKARLEGIFESTENGSPATYDDIYCTMRYYGYKNPNDETNSLKLDEKTVQYMRKSLNNMNELEEPFMTMGELIEKYPESKPILKEKFGTISESAPITMGQFDEIVAETRELVERQREQQESAKAMPEEVPAEEKTVPSMLDNTGDINLREQSQGVFGSGYER